MTSEARAAARPRLQLASTAIALLGVGSLLLPWIKVGAQSLSSIRTLDTAGTLDLVGGGTRTLAIGAWFSLPALAAAVLLSHAARRPRLAAALEFTLGVVLIGFALGIKASYDGSLAWGAFVGLAFGVAACVSTVPQLLPTASAERTLQLSTKSPHQSSMTNGEAP